MSYAAPAEPLADPIVIVAIIGFFQAITLAFLTWLLARVGRIKKDTAETKDQVVNHHPKSPNMRVENDRRHEETRRWFTAILKRMNTMERNVHNRVDGIAGTVDELLTGFLENRERIEDIEKTNGGKKHER